MLLTERNSGNTFFRGRTPGGDTVLFPALFSSGSAATPEVSNILDFRPAFGMIARFRLGPSVRASPCSGYLGMAYCGWSGGGRSGVHRDVVQCEAPPHVTSVGMSSGDGSLFVRRHHWCIAGARGVKIFLLGSQRAWGGSIESRPRCSSLWAIGLLFHVTLGGGPHGVVAGGQNAGVDPRAAVHPYYVRAPTFHESGCRSVTVFGQSSPRC